MKVHIDCHVEVDHHRCSVPQALVALDREPRVTDGLVAVLHRGQRVACRARSSRRGGFTTVDSLLRSAAGRHAMARLNACAPESMHLEGSAAGHHEV